MLKGLVFDIQGYSVHDGPGCRTTVFLSGCPLSCVWCSNPEGMLLHRRLLYRKNKCRRCHRCITNCPQKAITAVSPELLQFDRQYCESCETFACTERCFYEALKVSGRYVSVSELAEILKRDRMFWSSEGGVTFSGGDPLLQHGFVLASLQKCKEAYIHTAVETSAHIDTPVFLEVMEYVDWAFVDIKHIDCKLHRENTGRGNELILKNLKVLTDSRWKGRLIIRIPIIPGYNDTPECLVPTAKFVKDLGLQEINLLPFHRFGNSKYDQLGTINGCSHLVSPEPANVEKMKQWIESTGLMCYVGHETPF